MGETKDELGKSKFFQICYYRKMKRTEMKAGLLFSINLALLHQSMVSSLSLAPETILEDFCGHS